MDTTDDPMRGALALTRDHGALRHEEDDVAVADAFLVTVSDGGALCLECVEHIRHTQLAPRTRHNLNSCQMSHAEWKPWAQLVK